VMACPFCSIMLKGAQASSSAAVELTDVVSYVAAHLPAAATTSAPFTDSPDASSGR